MVSTGQQTSQPSAEWRVALRERRQRRPRPVNEQFAKVSVPSLGDAEETRFAASGVLPSHDAEPSRKVSGAVECLAPPDRRDQRGCIDDADAGNGR